MTNRNSIYNETALIVHPSTREDRYMLNQFFNNSEYHAVYDSEWNCFVLPNEEDTLDELEMELNETFGELQINASFEANLI
jgi:hypothetical protein